MKTLLSAVSASLAMILAVSAAPRLVVSTPSLTPESEIDLVLDLPVTATADLGKTVDNTWVEITPPLPGKLLWKAQNIARLVPDQAPVIGATYTFSIPKNLKHLDGTPVPAGKFATVASDPFLIQSATMPDRWSSGFSPSTARWILVFNDGVDPVPAAAFVSFSSKSGQRVAAKLERATFATASYYGRGARTWAQRFEQRNGNSVAPELVPESPVPAVLIATPLSPLPVGKEWSLSVLKGLPDAKGQARLNDDLSYEIGSIEPFLVSGINGVVSADQPRAIRVSFNHPLPSILPEDFPAASVSVVPDPGELAVKVDGRDLYLTGNFGESDKYRVSIRPPLVSSGGLSLVSSLEKEVAFERLDPELVLPSENQAQLSGGSRAYRIQTVNLSAIHVRVKKLSGAGLVRAYQGYQHYTGVGHDAESITPVAPLPYSLVAGETLVDKEISLDNSIDTSKEITLVWDELLPKDLRNAAIFLDITGTPHPGTGSEGRRNSQALVQLTDIGLAWKLTGKEAFIYAFSCDTGAPLPGVKLELFGEDASAISSALTDASGLASIPRSDAARHLHATLGNDGYLTAFDSTLSTVGLWHFPIRYSWNKPPESSRQAFLFTDRSLYRPGETVRLKGIVRTKRGNAIEPAATTPARVVIVDPADREIHTGPVTVSPNGSFDLTYALPPSKTGTHTVRLEFPEEIAKAETLDEDDWEARDAIMEYARFELPLRVEEFRRNAFEVTQTIAVPAPAATTITADLAAKYYQGQPVAAGGVKHFTRISTRNPYPERFRDFLFGNHRVEDWSYWYHYFGYRSNDDESDVQSSQIQGEAFLSTEGKAAIAIQIPRAEFPTAREVVISSEITDANHQTLTASTTATVHPASVYVGVSRVDRLVRAGDAVPVKIVATGTDGEPFAAAVKITATLTREVNSAVKSRADGGATSTRNDVTEEAVASSEVVLEPSASAGPGTDFTLVPKSNGLHFLTLRGTDPEGRPFATVTRFHVYGTQEYPWLYEDGLRVKLVSERKSYKPGDTARVLVLSPIEGTALVTVEREKVLRSFLVELKADKPVIEIPLAADDAPNAFVSVLIVKGAKESARDHKQPQLRLGYCELTVENLRDTLTVSIAEPAASYRPGDEVVLTGSVALAGGKPAAGAEVTLYAEDEGTLAVMGYETPRPMDYFYRPRMLDVEAGTSFETFISEDPEQQYFSNKGFFIGGGGDLGKLADLLRKNFDPCGTWAPSIITDGEGKFAHSFKVPDTLTRYRVIAIAHHDAARFGTGESSLVVNKDLMLEPKSPRFANQGDTFTPQVLVQNASAYNGTWEIGYSTGSGPKTPCAVPLGSTKETVTIAAGASATVVFPTRAEDTGEAVLTWQATPVSLEGAVLTTVLKHKLSDAVETRFPVLYPMPLLRQTKLVNLAKPGVKQDLRAGLDAALLDGSGEIDLEFSRSPLVEAAGSIDFLLSYPHGCVEQTTSSLIPWLSVESLAPVIPRFAKIPEKKVEAAIQAGADRLLSMQLPDGSFAYWPGSTDSAPWATAYAGMGLMMAAEKGAEVPPSAIESLTKYLAESLRGIADVKSPSVLESHTRALLVLALAGEPQPAYRNLLADRIADLTPSARALLATATALEDEGNETNLAIAKSIVTSKVPFKLKNDDWMPWSADDAYHVIAWLAIDPEGAEPVKALDRMLNDRNPYGHWQTTWVNGWSLMAMAAFAESQDLDGDPVSLAFESTGGTEAIVLSAETPVATRNFKLGPDLKLALASTGSAFVRVKIAAKPRIAPVQPVASNGLSIDRIYERVNSDGTSEILTEPKVGDLIRVSLRVTLPKDNTRYLVIEDPLPSVFETVNTDFKSQRAGAGLSTSENDWQVSHSELRTDRAAFFLDHVWRKGTYTVTYLARCTVAGEAVAPPAKVESMYDPDNFALSASRGFMTK